MGLATVQNIVNQCNGAIAVESTMHEGTTFRIYFPVIEESPALLSQEVLPLRHRSGETVVVVEDDEFVREVISDMLESAGYQVLTAKTGAEGLSVLKNYSDFVDLFLIATVLPDVDGRELGDRLIAIKPCISLAYMSSRNDEALIEGIQNTRVIQKPFTMKTLLDRVRRSLDSRN